MTARNAATPHRTTAVSLPPRALRDSVPPRPLRLDEIFHTQERGLESAGALLTKVVEIRARTLGEVPSNEKNEAVPCRAGKLGSVEDQAERLNRILAAVHEVVEDLLGI